MEGFLKKTSKRPGPARSLWFVLSDNTLAYYARNDKLDEAKDFILLQNVTSIQEDAKDHGFTITWDDKTLHLQAASKEERTKWVEALTKHKASALEASNKAWQRKEQPPQTQPVVFAQPAEPKTRSAPRERTVIGVRRNSTAGLDNDQPPGLSSSPSKASPPSESALLLGPRPQSRPPEPKDKPTATNVIPEKSQPASASAPQAEKSASTPVPTNPFEDSTPQSQIKEAKVPAVPKATTNPFDDDTLPDEKVQSDSSSSRVSSQPTPAPAITPQTSSQPVPQVSSQVDVTAPQAASTKQMPANPFDDSPNPVAPTPVQSAQSANPFVEHTPSTLTAKPVNANPAQEITSPSKYVLESEISESMVIAMADHITSSGSLLPISESAITSTIASSFPEKPETTSMDTPTVDSSVLEATASDEAPHVSDMPPARSSQETVSSDEPTAASTRRIPVNSNGYAVITMPAQLQGLLKKNVPSGLRGVTAGGIIFDWDPVKKCWSLNAKGKSSISPPQQEILRRITKAKQEALKLQNFQLAAQLSDKEAQVRQRGMPSYGARLTSKLVLCFINGDWELQDYEAIVTANAAAKAAASQEPQETGVSAFFNSALDWLGSSMPQLDQIPSALSSLLGKVGSDTAPITTIQEPQTKDKEQGPPSATVTAKSGEQKPGFLKGLSDLVSPISSTQSVELAASEADMASALQPTVTAVRTILEYFASETAPKTVLGDDQLSAQVTRLVRYSLCSALANVLLNGFNGSRFLGPAYHIWDFICASSSSIPEHEMSNQALLSVQALRNSIHIVGTTIRDNNMRFRAFICEALNVGMLSSRLKLLFSNKSVVSKFYFPQAVMVSAVAREKLISVLEKLDSLPFTLRLDFEQSSRPKC